MKHSKKLLAVLLACVLMLAALAGCTGTVDATSIPPTSVQRAYEVLNNGATPLGLQTLTYNTKYDEITLKIVKNYVNNYMSGAYTTYSKTRKEILAELKTLDPNATLMIDVIITDDGTVKNPISNTGVDDWNFEGIYNYEEKSAWADSTYVSMATYGGNSSIQEADPYLIVCTYKVTK